jgi:arylsulfatase A-like enzyme
MTHDLFPTFLELAGIDKPSADSPYALDGVSLTPVFFNEDTITHRLLFWAFGKQRAVRKNEWKLIRTGDKDPELYNLLDDPEEQRDLSSQEPEKVIRLANALEEWEAMLFQ